LFIQIKYDDDDDDLRDRLSVWEDYTFAPFYSKLPLPRKEVVKEGF